jgi:hypothetical protein
MTTTTTAYQTATAVPATPLSRRGEQREDARLRAELEIAREAARAEQRRLDDQAWAEERRQARAERDARKAAARARRAAAGAARRAWLRDHAVDLLFVPVIGVPGALAWDAMAAYGTTTWGPLGVTLPLFSEGAMWAFDAAVAIRRRRDSVKPVWHLQLGIAIFAAYGAALNFLHGMAVTTPHHGMIVAVSMALVSIAGVTAHQLVIAGPRRSPAERELERFRRESERRQAAARKAATRMSLVDIDEQGHADLIYETGSYQLTRGIFGGRRLAPPKDRPATVPASMPISSAPHAEPAAGYTPMPAGIAGQPAAAADRTATSGPAVRTAAGGRAGFPPPVFYGPDADWHDLGLADDDREPVAEWAGWPVDAVAEQIAVQIRAATAVGDSWKPDYEQLIALTDKSKRWCESAVSKARRLAGDGQPSNGKASRAARSGPEKVPDADRTPSPVTAGDG